MARSLLALALAGRAAGFGYHTVDDGNCMLGVPSAADGGFAWVQTGAVTQLWTTSSHPRDMILTVEETEVVNGAFYTPFCLGEEYTMDIGCVVQCVDGEIDYATYCPVAPESVCVLYTESEMYQDCQLDFDTDDEFADTGKSLKAMWAEVLDIWYTNVETIFTQPFMSTSLDDTDPNPFTPYYGTTGNFDRMMILPHGTGNLINMGLAMNVGINSWYYTGGYQNLTAEAFNLAVYTPMDQPDYEFTSDPFGSTSDGDVFFPDVFGVTAMPGCNLFGDLSYNTTGDNGTTLAVADGACIYQTTEYPEDLGLKPTYLGVIAMNYDPCHKDGDDVFMGLPKACFHIHQSGPHFANGQMMPFYKPLKSGKLDFFGVCSAEELSAQEYLSNLLLQKTPEADGYDADGQSLDEAAVAAGGMQLPHGRTWGLHLCLDFDDIYHPYPCMLGTTPQRWNGNGDLTDFMILDPLSFVYNPVKYEDEVCAAHEAGDCDWYNYMSLPVSISGVPAGDGSITQQDYAIDSPTTWVDYSTV